VPTVVLPKISGKELVRAFAAEAALLLERVMNTASPFNVIEAKLAG